ncbi:ABC transporter ATP-binding protein [Brevibacillus reuszeri]|uniref:ABC transporter ATP-binding protein n=1 Tax=Brevibacillus reuszeri TaxID=54915 RepID=UPI000CCC7DD6|nr:ABC transporter ATP-binding protein [Brevibacillus reuszeri]
MDVFGLEIDQVEKTIQGKTIVHPFSLRIEPGEVVALCGGNGAGKSTILRMIVGILRPTSGTIQLNGLNWNDHRVDYLQQIGYMPDHFTFSPGLTASETIRFYASLRNRSAEEADHVLAAVGLHEHRNKRVSQFSKGMQQRLLFAQAILAKPALVILDEPTNGLDPYWMDGFVDLVREIKLAGQTVIFSTHQLQVADAIADRAIFLMNGQIVRDSPIEDYQLQYGGTGLYGAFSELFSKAQI